MVGKEVLMVRKVLSVVIEKVLGFSGVIEWVLDILVKILALDEVLQVLF